MSYRFSTVTARASPSSLLLPCLLALSITLALPAQAQDPSALAFDAFNRRQQLLHDLGDRSQRGKALGDRVFRSSFGEVGLSCSLDGDADGLVDCVETATGVFVDRNNTGTNPEDSDTDGDGISDGAEVLGGDTGLDLAALGASPVHQDLLLEYDWFDSDYDCGPHSQRPTAAIAAKVALMFAGADIANPDGLPGIHLIQDYGQGGLFAGGNRIDGYDAILPGSLSETYRNIKRDNFDPARLGYFRYVLMPHRYNGATGSSSGYAEVVGDDAIVSLYCQNSESNVVQTIAHEVGHLLGLQHGGFEACNGKPNYNSLMNYRFQFSGIDSDCNGIGDIGGVDYSAGERINLEEGAVDESKGVCGAPSIDWNGNGQIELDQVLDLNPGNDSSCGNALTRLQDFDDWHNITFYGLSDFTGALKSIQTTTECSLPPQR